VLSNEDDVEEEDEEEFLVVTDGWPDDELILYTM
jgi:hypothetical protein